MEPQLTKAPDITEKGIIGNVLQYFGWIVAHGSTVGIRLDDSARLGEGDVPGEAIIRDYRIKVGVKENVI